MFLTEGCSIAAYDPAAMQRAAKAIPAGLQMRYAASEYDAAQGADALLILTDWNQFGELDLKRLQSTLRYPIVIDGRNLYNPQAMIDPGFTYLSMGRAAAFRARKTVPDGIH